MERKLRPAHRARSSRIVHAYLEPIKQICFCSYQLTVHGVQDRIPSCNHCSASPPSYLPEFNVGHRRVESCAISFACHSKLNSTCNTKPNPFPPASPPPTAQSSILATEEWSEELSALRVTANWTVHGIQDCILSPPLPPIIQCWPPRSGIMHHAGHGVFNIEFMGGRGENGLLPHVVVNIVFFGRKGDQGCSR